MTDDIKLPPLPRLQVPLIEADVSLLDIKALARWCERTATDYARAAVLADRASREPSPQGDALAAEAERVRGELREQMQRDEDLLRQALDALAYWLEVGETPGSHDIIQRTHDVLRKRLK